MMAHALPLSGRSSFEARPLAERLRMTAIDIGG
jgi:hypothetical protein